MTDESRPRRTIRADRGDAGERLDRVLLRHLNDLPEASRTKIQEWIEAGLVSVNGKTPGKSSEKVRDRDEVIVVLPPPPAPRAPLVPQEIPLAVLFEDSEILVLNKPPGLVVHPAVGHRDGTLVNALLHRSKEWAGPADRPGLVHRLDKDTSGVLVVAKTERAMAVLGKAMKERFLEKEYLAAVYGHPPVRKGKIEMGILRDPKDRKRMAASKAGGRPSTTFYEVLSESSGSLSGLALLKCTLVTGRTHQIRVHLKALDLPVVGDPTYGSPRWKGIKDEALRELCREFPRQALHAWRLTLRHPATGEKMTFTAPVPDDIEGLLEAAGLSPADRISAQ
ncbi:MAG TPA: RluA family pseudouridine synthase [Thermoanaerobaculia bacterium]|nr:RluA family pseudouridine synthase [Thermoanaerobaculia bacterium]